MTHAPSGTTSRDWRSVTVASLGGIVIGHVARLATVYARGIVRVNDTVANAVASVVARVKQENARDLV